MNLLCLFLLFQLGKRATPLRNGIRLDKMKVSKDEQAFLIELHKYMKSRNTPIGRIPSLGFKQSKDICYYFHSSISYLV